MERYVTKDNLVSKYIHDDGAETAIKKVSSCDNIVNKITGDLEPVEVDRDKYSVFISSSVGCPVGCKFCYLTVKNFPYYKLTPEQIFNNFKEAMIEEVKHNPSIRKKFIKVSWMGMGDAFLLNPHDLSNLSYKMVRWVIGDKGYAIGLDGVDIGTCMPRNNYGWPHALSNLNDCLLNRFSMNPNNPDKRAVRLFYSFHGGMDRDILPTRRDVSKDLDVLYRFKEWYGIDVILHQLFIEGINDKVLEVQEICDTIKGVGIPLELRILRYNACHNSPYKESIDFTNIVRHCAGQLSKVKYQVSAGSEIKASCGQFLCKELKK